MKIITELTESNWATYN